MAQPNLLDVRRNDLNLTYRPQREWIEGKGLLLVVAHFFSGIGAGAWLFATVLDFPLGLVLGWVCVALLSGLAHLLFLGRIERFWRMVRRPHSSWISRGLWGIGIFVAAGSGLLIPAVRESALGGVLVALSLVGVGIILLYEGFVFAASRGIPFWSTRLLPLLYIAYGLRGGAALLLVATVVGGAALDIHAMEVIKLWVVVSTAVLILLLLVTGSRAGGAARHSVRELVAGRISPAFYGGTVVAGILIPVALGMARELGTAGLTVVAVIGVASLIGDFYVKYCVVKAGAYAPLRGAALSVLEAPAAR
jgi:formate-dependent nitrite reductase membrane component NrfD